MRVLVAVVSAGAAMALIMASGQMNYVFMTSLGKTPFEQQILGQASIAFTIFLTVLPTLIVWAWREGRGICFLLGLLAFCGFAAFSLSSAIGFAAKNRGSISEDRALAAAKLHGLRQEVEDAQKKLTALSPYRPFTVVEQSLRGLEQDRRWQSSKACREATVEASRSFCKGYFELKAEAARADEAARIERRIAELKGKAQRLEDEGAGREADNQASVLAYDLGLQVAVVERGLMVLLAALVEFGAALGLYLATGHLGIANAGPAWGRGAPRAEAGTAGHRSGGRLKRARDKRIASNVPRRVPPLGRSETMGSTIRSKRGN